MVRCNKRFLGLPEGGKPRSAGAPSLPVAFTLIELLVVITVILLLAALLLPVLTRAKSRAQGVVCMGNLRQLQFAWHFYADDHSDLLPCNATTELAGRDPRYPAWVAGNMRYVGFGGLSQYDSDRTNGALLLEPGVGHIGPYLRTAGVFRCPSDKSTTVLNGRRHRRVRTCSINGFMGGGHTSSTTGYGNGAETVYMKLADVVHPPPSKAFVVIDEHEDSLDGPLFEVHSGSETFIAPWWLDLPASRHNGAGVLTFADGHAEFRRWVDPRTRPKVVEMPLGAFISIDNRDIFWLRERATALRRDYE